MAESEPATDVACAEPALSADVREALALLRDHSDEEFRELIDEVLAGRRSLLDASGTTAFGTAVFGRIADEFGERLATMTDEEKQNADTACGISGDPCGGCTSICAISRTSPPQEP